MYMYNQYLPDLGFFYHKVYKSIKCRFNLKMVKIMKEAQFKLIYIPYISICIRKFKTVKMIRGP